ncbi:MAG TPA: hypothetical protein VGG27_07410 [Magnetospirillaceae bacterium]|jgi:hypothetical protein
MNTPELSWQDKYKLELRQMAVEAKDASANWAKRWHLSLTVGNAAGLAAVGSAVLSLVSSRNPSSFLGWCIIPAAWLFMLGLFAGAFLPYAWVKRLEKRPLWADLREQEVEANQPVQVPIDIDADDWESSETILAEYVGHWRRWDSWFIRFEVAASICFVSAVLWLTICSTIWFTRLPSNPVTSP